MARILCGCCRRRAARLAGGVVRLSGVRVLGGCLPPRPPEDIWQRKRWLRGSMGDPCGNRFVDKAALAEAVHAKLSGQRARCAIGDEFGHGPA